MRMLTVGCSEGHDATAWHTRILNARMRGFLQGQPAYEAIECEFAPKQGRSGGGLFTTDGYIAGVCNFAEPQGNHGLYATPQSIYTLLDRNDLSHLYAPVVRGSDAILADGGQPSSRPQPEAPQVQRLQSPDSDPPVRRRPAADSGEVLLPHYSLLGIKDPVGTDGDSAGPRPAASRGTRRVAWHPTQGEPPAEADQIETSSTAPATTDATSNPARPRWRPVDAAGQRR
jgi:hypothetical protein